MTNNLVREVNVVTYLGSTFISDCDAEKHIKATSGSGIFFLLKYEIEGKKTSMLAQMYDRKRILVMLQIMWPNISY